MVGMVGVETATAAMAVLRHAGGRSDSRWRPSLRSLPVAQHAYAHHGASLPSPQVEAKYMAQKLGSSLAKWFPGRIESAPDAEGRCNVRYEDGDFEALVPSRYLRWPQMVSRLDGERHGEHGPEVRASNARVGSEAAVGSPASASAAGRPTKRPRTGGGSGGGSAATGGVDGSEGDRIACDAETVYRLCGRVLAKALIEGVACCVDDKLPLFVLEYVMTSDDL
jgi:hypothetical protein